MPDISMDKEVPLVEITGPWTPPLAQLPFRINRRGNDVHIVPPKIAPQLTVGLIQREKGK